MKTWYDYALLVLLIALLLIFAVFTAREFAAHDRDWGSGFFMGVLAFGVFHQGFRAIRRWFDI